MEKKQADEIAKLLAELVDLNKQQLQEIKRHNRSVEKILTANNSLPSTNAGMSFNQGNPMMGQQNSYGMAPGAMPGGSMDVKAMIEAKRAEVMSKVNTAGAGAGGS